MSKKGSILICSVLISVLAFGCVKPVTHPASVLPSVSELPETSETEVVSEDDSWKPVMRDAVLDAMKEYWGWIQQDSDIMTQGEFTEDKFYKEARFELAYIDDDDIPELFVQPSGSGVWGIGCCILSVKDGKSDKYDIGWSDFVEYIPRSDRIVLMHGMHMPHQEIVYKWSTEEELGSGTYYEPGWYDGQDRSFEGEEYEYRWNDESVSEADYNAKRKEVFDGESRTLGEGDLNGFADILVYLNSSQSTENYEMDEETAIAYLDVILNDPDGLYETYNTGRMKYGLLKINDDDLPELVVYRLLMDQFGCEKVDVYTSKDGKAVNLPLKTGYTGISWAKSYYERKDYIYIEHCHEAIYDESQGFEYCPVFDSNQPNLMKWNISYPLGYDTGKEADYDKLVEDIKCTSDGAEISNEEFSASLDALHLGAGKPIADECKGFAEAVERITRNISPERTDDVKATVTNN